MAEENENKDTEEEAPEQAEAPEADAPAEDAPAAEQAEAPEADTASSEDAADAAEDAADAADDESLSPKERRRLERSRSSGPPGPERSTGERAGERHERRRANAERRRRYRARLRQRRGEPGTGTPPADRAPGKRKVRVGKVVSSRAPKTITVRIERARRDPTYEKVVRRSSTVHAHDERDEASEGDVVRVVETRPLSRTKRWRLVEILERAR